MAFSAHEPSIFSLERPRAWDNASPPIPPVPTSQPQRSLFGLKQLEVSFEAAAGVLWTFMRPNGRPCYNQELLLDFHAWQDGIEHHFRDRETDLRYLVLGSRFPGIFCLGGDLNLFTQLIRNRDRAGLVAYGRSCVRILYRNLNALNMPMITIGLVQGDALGGGFESLLSFNVIVAEKGSKFGLPEQVFGLFPGMGAASLLARRIGSAKAEAMMLSGESLSAETMHELGLVHILAEPGQGIEVVKDYIARSRRKHAGQRAIYRASREVNPVTMGELEQIVEIWASSSLELADQNLKVMERLVSAQNRLLGIHHDAPRTDAPRTDAPRTEPRRTELDDGVDRLAERILESEGIRHMDRTVA